MSPRPPLGRRIIARLRGPGAWRTWLGLGLLTLITIYAFYRIFQYDLRDIDIGELLGRLSPSDIGLAVGAYVLALALALAGWGLIIGALSGCWRWLDHVRIYCITQITRRLPGTYWYLLGRVVMYEQLGVGRGVTALASGIELAVTCVGGLVVALVTWPLVFGAQGQSQFWLALALIGLAALLNPLAVRWIVRRLSPHTPQVRYRHILLWSLLYAMIWVLGGVMLFVLASAVHPLPLAALPALIGVWAITGLAAMTIFSFLPLGLGATELTITALIGDLLPGTEALFVAFAMRVVLTLCELSFGLLGLLIGLPALLRSRADGTGDQSDRSHQEAENPEGVFEAGAVVPRKEAGFGPK